MDIKIFKFLNNRFNYNNRKEQEIKHFTKSFKNRLSQKVPEVWNQVEKHFSDCIEKVTKVRNLYEYVGFYCQQNHKKRVNVLSLGSGACGNELKGIAPILKKIDCQMDLICTDINEAPLKQAATLARNKGIKFSSLVQDINKISLPAKKFDIVIAYSALHHFVKLNHISKQINKGLKTKGIFVTVDIPTRNGYKMWNESFCVVNHIWDILPSKFKIDHTGFAKPTYIDKYPNIDYSLNTFECINSEAILPSLRKNLKEVVFVPALTIARRFFDTKFGPNYNLKLDLDKSIFDFIINLDSFYIENQILKPETFFGVYGKKKK